ncbi:TspO/MBR family protein [Falsiroseomonas sp. HW251]|uniref:TspO/MBR family protein n=1 Tax=Falsiroseomonas sp. HW251 TaxID=3390998 RepID=UPI003D323F80
MGRRADPLLGAVLLGGALVASAALSARWSPAPIHPRTYGYYRRLEKPSFTPPDAAFAVWGPLWAALAAAGWRLWRAKPSAARSRALAHWFGAQALNTLWLWLGFQRRNRAAMAVEAGATVVNAAALADAARRVDGPAAVLALPYLAWIGFAGLLSEEIWRLNEDRGEDGRRETADAP